MPEKPKKSFLGRLFGEKNQHDKLSPEDGVHRRPDETPSDQVPEGLAKSFQPGTSREPHAANVEEDSEAGQPEFLHEKPDFGEDDEDPSPLGPAAATGGEPSMDDEAAGDIEAAGQVAPQPGGAPPAQQKRGLFGRLAEGMSKTSSKLGAGIAEAFVQKRELTDEALETLEDHLIAADLGLPAAQRITARLSKTRYKTDITMDEVRGIMAAEIAQTLAPLERPLAIDPAHKPHVVLVAGVNGAGKTTTIGKLAQKLRDEGRSVLMVAGDTFRAAAIEQLQVWGERTGCPVETRPQGADAAGLAYDAIERARREGIDVVLIDTAGRLQNRTELMDELRKVVRVMRKLDADAPHDSLLVLDATVGQNALRQAEVFTEAAGTTGLVMTKLDGTARGGVLVALADKFALPIHYVGVGEAVEDLQVFDADAFARALTAAEKTA